MANIKIKYAEIVKKAKQDIKDFYKANEGSKDPAFLAEDRIIKIIQRRAREDFGTLKKKKG